MKVLYEVNHYEDLNNEKRIVMDTQFSRFGFISNDNSKKLEISGLIPTFKTDRTIKTLFLSNVEVSHIFEIKNGGLFKYVKVNHIVDKIEQNEFDKSMHSICPVIFVDNNKLAEEIITDDKYNCKGLLLKFEFMVNEGDFITMSYYIANEDLEAVNPNESLSDFANEFKIY